MIYSNNIDLVQPPGQQSDQKFEPNYYHSIWTLYQFHYYEDIVSVQKQYLYHNKCGTVLK